MNKFINNIRRNILLITAVATAVMVVSCIKEYHDMEKYSDRMENDFNFAGPIAFGTFEAKRLINQFDDNNQMYEYDDNLLYVVYQDTTESDRADQIIIMEDQNLKSAVKPSNQGYSGPFNGSVQFVAHNRYDFEMDKSERVFDSMYFDQGTAEARVTSFGIPGTVIILFDSIRHKVTGEPLRFDIPISPVDGGVESQTKPLNEYRIVFAHPAISQTKTQITYKITVTLNGTGTIGTDDSLLVNIDLTNLDFNRIYGFFGTDTVLKQDRIPIIIAMSDEGSKFYFTDPRFRIDIFNSFGFPTYINLKKIKAMYPEEADFDSLIFEFDPPSKAIFSINNPQIGDDSVYRQTTKIFKNEDFKGNNFSTILTHNPDELDYTAQAYSNKDIVFSEQSRKQFVYDTSKIKLKIGAEIPIQGFTNRFIQFDTVENLSFGDYSIKELYELSAYLKIVNQMPCDISVQFYFTDSTFQIIDSLFEDATTHIAEAAAVNTNGEVTDATEKTTIASVTQDDMEKWDQIANGIIAVYFHTFEYEKQREVKILSTNYIKVNIALKARGLVNSLDF